MRLDKFTLRAQEAIQSAIELAERSQNQQVEPEHLLAAMLEQPEGIVRPVLGKLGVNVQVVLNDVQAAISRFPRVEGGQQYFSPRLSQILTATQKLADKMQDEFNSTEHLLVAIVDEKPTFVVFSSGDAALGIVAKRGRNLAGKQDQGDHGKRLAFLQKPRVIQADASPIRQT